MGKSKINWMKLKEIEEKYEISAVALRKYIMEEKIGNFYLKYENGKWHISENWIKKLYKKR